jgi:hypothetical protein
VTDDDEGAITLNIYADTRRGYPRQHAHDDAG